MKAYFTDSTEAWNYATDLVHKKEYTVTNYGIDSLHGEQIYWIEYERKEEADNGKRI